MRVGLLGHGYWGKILERKLKSICNIVFICTSKDEYISKLDSIDWAFVATPNNTHYDIVKQCIMHRKNVFCEKPLTLTYEQSKELFDLADEYGVKLYVDDVFNYRTEKKHIKNLTKPITVRWNKISDNTLYDLLYHDLYLLWPYWKYPYEDIKFTYNVSDNRIHKINDIDFTNTENSNDALSDMIDQVLYGTPDYEYNKTISLMCNKIINRLQSEQKNNKTI
tara:strand:- start:10966 stop:11631 length:666 start_codon:yes stop_codon:yes gene_type:complete